MENQTVTLGTFVLRQVPGRGCGGLGGGRRGDGVGGELPQGASPRSDQGLPGPGRVEVSTAHFQIR